MQANSKTSLCKKSFIKIPINLCNKDAFIYRNNECNKQNIKGLINFIEQAKFINIYCFKVVRTGE